jgi:hypothetical protein
MQVSTGVPAARKQGADAVPKDVLGRVRVTAESVGGRPVFAERDARDGRAVQRGTRPTRRPEPTGPTRLRLARSGHAFLLKKHKRAGAWTGGELADRKDAGRRRARRPPPGVGAVRAGYAAWAAPCRPAVRRRISRRGRTAPGAPQSARSSEATRRSRRTWCRTTRRVSSLGTAGASPRRDRSRHGSRHPRPLRRALGDAKRQRALGRARQRRRQRRRRRRRRVHHVPRAHRRGGGALSRRRAHIESTRRSAATSATSTSTASGRPRAEPTRAADDSDPDEVAWSTAVEAAPWLLAPPSQRRRPTPTSCTRSSSRSSSACPRTSAATATTSMPAFASRASSRFGFSSSRPADRSRREGGFRRLQRGWRPRSRNEVHASRCGPLRGPTRSLPPHTSLDRGPVDRVLEDDRRRNVERWAPPLS